MPNYEQIHLGPRQIVVKGEIIGAIDDVILDINQVDESELNKLKEAQTIQLVKIIQG